MVVTEPSPPGRTVNPGPVPAADVTGGARAGSARERLAGAATALADRLPGGGQWATLWVVLAVGVLIMGLATELASDVYVAVLDKDGLATLDGPVLQEMVTIRRPWLNTAVTVLTTFGGPVVAPIVAAVVVAVLGLRWRSWLPVVLMVAAAAGSVTMTVVGKRYAERIRPDHAYAVPPYEFSPSFPSGHSLNAVVVAGVVAYLLLRQSRARGHRCWIVLLTVGYALVMGASRVYLGHHWLTDVVTGWLLGTAWLAFIITAHRLVVTVERNRAGSVVVRADPDDPEAAALLREYTAEVGSRQLGRPATEAEIEEFVRTNSSTGMRPPDGEFLLVRRAGRALGCAGVRWLDAYTGEVKRMYVAPAGRGHGLGRVLLDAAHEAIRPSGRNRSRLDTRGELGEAIGLYRAAGYREIPRYNENPYAQQWFEADLTSR